MPQVQRANGIVTLEDLQRVAAIAVSLIAIVTAAVAINRRLRRRMTRFLVDEAYADELKRGSDTQAAVVRIGERMDTYDRHVERLVTQDFPNLVSEVRELAGEMRQIAQTCDRLLTHALTTPPPVLSQHVPPLPTAPHTPQVPR